LQFVRILIVAGGELRGILRSHPYRLFLPVAALVVLLSPLLVLFAFRDRAAMVAQVGVSAAGFFAVLLGLLAGSAALARERESGVRDVVLARSLSSVEYVAGKWLGIFAAAALAVATLSVVHLVSLAFRGGPPLGYAPVLAALVLAAAAGGLAAAVGLVFSAVFRAGAAFSGALLFVLASHAAGLMGETPVTGVLRFALPRLPETNLAAEAAFGPLSIGLVGGSLLHLSLYTLFLLSLAAPLSLRLPSRAE